MELPSVMESLRIEGQPEEDPKPAESDETPSSLPAPSTPTPSRTLRKRVYGITSMQQQMNATNESKKKTIKIDTERKVLDFYKNINKKWSVKHTNLETIFEEPKSASDGNVVTMSGAKVKRSILFNRRVTKTKQAKRKDKVKKFKLTKAKTLSAGKKKLTVEEVKLYLAESLDS
ncbi:Protein tantalus [Frankliniella fusca]|uniref:Protein tantalus n=1 Tax=Frankliniella fusca TaxID=407009 RepID=A0AAE1LS81_9NEOP|nr:Protein tantalus [Frankliniella fusca]